MKSQLYYPILIVLYLFSNKSNSQSNGSFNVLSIPNGAYVYSAPPTFKAVPETANKIVAWTKEAIIDGSNTNGWSSKQGAKFPMEFIFELSEMCIIEKMGFNTLCEKNIRA